MSPNLDSEARYSQAIATLTALKYDIRSIVDQHTARQATEDRKASEMDIRYPLSTPESWQPHFDNGTPTLNNSTIREGGRFVLTPGQRSILRDRYEMTPTHFVEVSRVELFPGTIYIKSVVLKSDLHIAESERKHALIQCCISDFGQWLHSSIERDEMLALVNAYDAKAKSQVEKWARDGKTKSEIQVLLVEWYGTEADQPRAKRASALATESREKTTKAAKELAGSYLDFCT